MSRPETVSKTDRDVSARRSRDGCASGATTLVDEVDRARQVSNQRRLLSGTEPRQAVIDRGVDHILAPCPKET